MSSTPRWTRLHGPMYGLKGERCVEGGHYIFPPRDVCPYCSHEKNEEYEINNEPKEKLEGKTVTVEYMPGNPVEVIVYQTDLLPKQGR